MIRAFALICSLLLAAPATAVQPAAPMDRLTIEKINAIFAPVEQRFHNEIQAAKGNNLATAETMGRYWNWMFHQAGYSHDETVFQFLTNQSTDQFEKAFFAREMGFGHIISQVASQQPGLTEGYLKSGALTQRTVDLIVNSTKPNTSGRELLLPPLAGWQYPPGPSTNTSRIRMELSTFKGEGEWADHVIFRNHGANDYYVLGERKSFSAETLAILDRIQSEDRSAIIQGEFRSYSGQGGNFRICFLDRSQAVTVILRKPIASYR